jgi:hypothetical protein
LEPGEHCIRERRFPPKVISAAKSFGPTIPDDENQEAFGRAKKGTNQKQGADLYPVFRRQGKNSRLLL